VSKLFLLFGFNPPKSALYRRPWRLHSWIDHGWRHQLVNYLEITELEVFALLQDLIGEIGVGPDAVSVYLAMTYASLPGRKTAGLLDNEGDGHAEPYIHNFPDGNASIARLLVRKMIPKIRTYMSKLFITR
jgi:hypothetical protein